MHEYSLITALVARVAEEARERKAFAVHRLSVSVGELSGVDPELFRTAYELFRKGTVCENADLALRTLPAMWSCPECGRPVERGAALTCSTCGKPARLGSGGDEILLESIEMEVP